MREYLLREDANDRFEVTIMMGPLRLVVVVFLNVLCAGVSALGFLSFFLIIVRVSLCVQVLIVVVSLH